MLRSLWLSVLLLGMARICPAQGPSIALSFAPDQVVDCGQREPFIPFHIYVVIQDAPPIKGWEMALDFDVAAMGFSRLGVTYNPPTCWCNSYEPYHWSTSLGGCFDFGVTGVLATIRLAWQRIDPMPPSLLCVRPTTPSSFDGQPGYLDCGNGLFPFTLGNLGDQGAPLGCLVINPTSGCTVGDISRQSFSAIKARFD